MTSMTTWQPQFNFQHTTSLVDELNRHWRDGGPSDQLSAAGVLVHILDGKGRSLRDLQPRLPLLRYDRHATETPFSVLVADDS